VLGKRISIVGRRMVTWYVWETRQIFQENGEKRKPTKSIKKKKASNNDDQMAKKKRKASDELQNQNAVKMSKME
jgi:hypothetical protein